MIDRYNDMLNSAITGTTAGLLESKIKNLTKSVSLTISASDWSSATTDVNGTAYYTATKQLAEVYDAHPDIMIGATGLLPTEAEKKAFGAVSYVTVSGTTLKLYAAKKPTSDFVIIVKGAK